MANITAACGRVRETNLGIQIRSVEVDLTTILMDDIARLLDAVLKHTVGGWVRDLGDKIRPGTNDAHENDGHHERCKVVFVLLCLRTEVHNVETTIWKALHSYYFQASHDCGLGVSQRWEVTARKG